MSGPTETLHEDDFYPLDSQESNHESDQANGNAGTWTIADHNVWEHMPDQGNAFGNGQ